MTTNKPVSENKAADAVLKQIEELAKTRFLPIIGPVKGPKLAETVKRFRVGKVLEVGTLVGYSAILMAKNLPEDGMIYTVELNPQSAKLAEENVAKAGFAEKVKINIGNALEVIPTIDEEFDMVFLDATKEEYLDYLKLCENRLKKGGVVFADNVKMFAGAMQDYLHYVRNSGKYRSEYFNYGYDGVEVSEKL